jgi:hypothetical protein
MKCREVKGALVAYLDGEVMPSERTLIEAHLAGCESCEKELSALGSSRGQVTDSLRTMAAQAAPSPHAWSHLQARIAEDAAGAGAKKHTYSLRRGDRPMKRRWRIALGTAGAVVLAAAVVAAVPTSRAAAGDFLAEVFHIESGPIAELGYLPVGFESGPAVVTGSATVAAPGEDAQQSQRQEQALYKNGDQFLLVKTSDDSGEPLPKGQAAAVNGVAAVLTTGLSGSWDGLPVPAGGGAVLVSGQAQIAPAASGEGQLVPIAPAGAGGVKVAPTPGEQPATIVVGSDGSVISESGISVSEGAPEGAVAVTSGTPPDMPSITYIDANSLTWVVNGTRVEILSNLPVAELQKIAEGLVLSD